MDKTKKIAVNTIFLCFRMLVLMLISFYSSRVLLKELGVTDFGIYGLVGGVVAIFSSLRGLFATATQRFLNYEMGNDNIGVFHQDKGKIQFQKSPSFSAHLIDNK